MPSKLKPSAKEFIRVNNKLTSKYKIKHYTPATTSTEDLKKFYEQSSFKRKKELIKKELIKRGKWES
tara:strand:- start:1939 stop:2139 length:201 start_codon:yes stop_codon:yes gene_type:complete